MIYEALTEVERERLINFWIENYGCKPELAFTLARKSVCNA